MPALTGLGLVATGLFLLLFKIGRPLRSIYVLRQPQRSWMSREAWIAGALFPLGILAIWFENRALLFAAAVCGVLFLYCQSMILQAAKGIPAWRLPQIVPLIVATGLAEGVGLFLALPLLRIAVTSPAIPIATALFLLVAGRGLAWTSYSNALRHAGAPVRSIAVLDSYRPWFLAFGLILPLASIALGILIEPAALLAFACGGLSAFAAGWALKLILVTRAGYNQGFALNHTPARGSGIAGAMVKPGWAFAMTPRSGRSNHDDASRSPR
jgi:phenylacetyl-CoA:acceptor oxidoreductase subunit 2